MDEETEVAVESEPVAERDFDAEARQEGWVPQDEWKGPKDKWVDSATFVERGEKISGILKSKIDRLEEKIDSLNQSNKQFGEYHKSQLEKERAKNERLITELEQVRKQAITEGDGDAFDRADRQLKQLEQQKQPTEQNVMTKMAQDWVGANPWYESNQRLQAYADGIADRIVAEGYTGKAYFNELTRRTREEFPEEFSNKSRARPGLVEGGGERETKNSKAKTYDNLPADAKAACANFVRGGFMTKEEYVKQYEWEQ